MSSLQYCSHCHEAILAEDEVCIHCGISTTQRPAKKMLSTFLLLGLGLTGCQKNPGANETPEPIDHNQEMNTEENSDDSSDQKEAKKEDLPKFDADRPIMALYGAPPKEILEKREKAEEKEETDETKADDGAKITPDRSIHPAYGLPLEERPMVSVGISFLQVSSKEGKADSFEKKLNQEKDSIRNCIQKEMASIMAVRSIPMVVVFEKGKLSSISSSNSIVEKTNLNQCLREEMEKWNFEESYSDTVEFVIRR